MVSVDDYRTEDPAAFVAAANIIDPIGLCYSLTKAESIQSERVFAVGSR
jgi:rRNA processing protein Krr1/Pno1